MSPALQAYCSQCGAACEQRIPPGDDRARAVCSGCGVVHYLNPRVVVGAVATCEDRLLLVQRAIAPRAGYWCIPSGFLEVGETSREGTAREAREEAGAELEVGRLLAVYELTHVQQVMLVYAATMRSPRLDPGPESLDARLLRPDEIPWDRLAFPTVGWALRYHLELGGREDYVPHTNPSDERMPRD
ncbi:MAG: NUDIX domain-containing protein [Planctomycetota bacterium]